MSKSFQQLKELLEKEKWSVRNEHPEFSYADWQHAYHKANTRKTYHDWVEEMIENE